MNTKSQVFICAKSTDFVYARQVFEFLKSRGIVPFLSDESLPERGSSDYRKEIDQALEQADHLVVVASTRKNVESPWVEAEWGFFINEKRSGRKTGNLLTIITGDLERNDLPPSLRYYEVLEMGEESLEKLLRYVGTPRVMTPLGGMSLEALDKISTETPLSSTQKRVLSILECGPQTSTEITRSLRDIHGSETRITEVRRLVEDMLKIGIIVIDDNERYRLSNSRTDLVLETVPRSSISLSETCQTVSDQALVVVRIDPRVDNGDKGKVLQMPYLPYQPVYDFLDEIYYFLTPAVDQFSFGKTWMLFDADTEKPFQHLQNTMNQRPLIEAGVKPGAILVVKLL